MRKDEKGCRKIPVVSGSRYCATPLFAFEPSERKIKKLHDDLVLSGKGLVFAELLSGNNSKLSLIYNTQSVTLKIKKVQKIYKIKMEESQLLECLIVFQVMMLSH